MFTSAARLLQEASSFTSEDLNMLGHTFVKHSNIFSIMAASLTLGTGLNQYMISMQLDQQTKKIDERLCSMEDKMKKIDERLGNKTKWVGH